MRIVTRAEWGARKPKSVPAKVAISARTATCVHHDGATPVIVRTFAEACARIRADQNYHMDSNGWADIGYNYLVISAPGTSVDGLIFEGRGRDAVGAHCLNWNIPWIGVQVAIGGAQKPSPAALVSVKWLHVGFAAAAGHAFGMKGHRDGFNTECPGPILYSWVHAGMPVTATPTTTPTPEVDVTLTPQEITAITVGAAEQVWHRFTVNGLTLQAALGRLVAASDPAALAAAVVKAMPASTGTVVTQAELEAALRTVLGSVDGKV